MNFELLSYQWAGSSPGFTLRAWSSGGPPEGHWERNEEQITKYTSDNITIRYELDLTKKTAYQEAAYYSLLIVNGRFPGEYRYSVSNRITDRIFTDSMFIEGTVCVNGFLC